MTLMMHVPIASKRLSTSPQRLVNERHAQDFRVSDRHSGHLASKVRSQRRDMNSPGGHVTECHKKSTTSWYGNAKRPMDIWVDLNIGHPGSEFIHLIHLITYHFLKLAVFIHL